MSGDRDSGRVGADEVRAAAVAPRAGAVAPHDGERALGAEEIGAQLRPGHPWSVHCLGEVASTMEEVRRLADSGAPSHTVVVAEGQTAGTGRHSRPWASARGEGLWMTVLLRPDLEADQAPLLTLASAVAVAEGLGSLGFPVGIKWPNDVLVAEGPLARRKLCGIRAEMELDEEGCLAWASLGVGVNVHQERFPDELASLAASLAMVGGGAPPSRAHVAAAVLDRLESIVGSLEEEGFGPLRRRWLARALGLGEEATVRDVEGAQRGIVRGMDEEGHLLLERPGDEEPYPIVAGDLIFPVGPAAC